MRAGSSVVLRGVCLSVCLGEGTLANFLRQIRTDGQRMVSSSQSFRLRQNVLIV